MSARLSAKLARQCWTILCIGLALASPAQAVQDSWKRITSPLTLQWPRDHGSHPDYETEWWYATGDLTDGAGRLFGFQITLFRRGLDASAPIAGESHLRPRQIFAANIAIVDVATGRLLRAERVRRGSAGLAGADEGDLHVWVEDWRIDRAADGKIALNALDVKQGIALQLELDPEKPLVLHGREGVSQKSTEPGNASIYTSWTRSRTRGTIRLGDADGSVPKDFTVSGESWFDHEFGSSQLGADVVGWDWFGVRFDDGRDLMLYRLRTSSGNSTISSAGTLVERDRSVRHLTASDFRSEPLESWKSTLTGASYPVVWRISVPSAGIECAVKARAAACELDARASVGLIYWEGPVSVSGSMAGSGYLELTGYSTPLTGRF